MLSLPPIKYRTMKPPKKWHESEDREYADWKRIRAAIEHENLLTNARMTWLLTTEAVFFAAYTTTITNALKTGQTPDYPPHCHQSPSFSFLSTCSPFCNLPISGCHGSL